MTTLASPAQLAARLQSTLDSDYADRVLTDASGLIRAVAQQDFDFVSQDTVILGGDQQVLTLPQRPLVVTDAEPLTIVEIGDFGAIDFTCVENRDYIRLGNELTRGFPYWMTSRLQGWPHRRNPTGVWSTRVRVTYSHGYLVIPDGLVSVVLDVAQAMYANPSGLRSWTTPEYAEVYATELLGAATLESIKLRLGAIGQRRGSFSI